ncbi:hypothetical protein AAHA92_15482 [Salvia divinorum]|uniref:Uncharacterized protein n=1 Tax=Salvia divinorum TaxID=28513 RepID=A0ABD1HEW5_SALDI
MTSESKDLVNSSSGRDFSRLRNPTKFKEEESTKSNFNNSSNACQEGGRVESFSACFLSTFTKRTSRGAKGFPDCSFSTHTHAQSFDSSSNIRRCSLANGL